jgi:hypothetical protein
MAPPEPHLDATHELAQRKRLGDVVIDARLEPGDPVCLLASHGQHDDPQVASLGAQLAAHLETIPARQHQVEHQHVRSHGPRPFERLWSARGRVHVEPLEREFIPHRHHDGWLIVCDKHALRHQASLWGKRIVKQLPPPGTLVTFTVPPCALAAAWTSDRPSPVPRPLSASPNRPR